MLALATAGAHRFSARSVEHAERTVVFGGQLIGQTIVAAKDADPDKDVRSVHTVFARAGHTAHPLQVSVDVLHIGRTMSTVYVRIGQGERTLCGSLVLLDTAEPDVLRASLPMPPVPGPRELDRAQRYRGLRAPAGRRRRPERAGSHLTSFGVAAAPLLVGAIHDHVGGHQVGMISLGCGSALAGLLLDMSRGAKAARVVG